MPVGFTRTTAWTLGLALVAPLCAGQTSATSSATGSATTATVAEPAYPAVRATDRVLEPVEDRKRTSLRGTHPPVVDGAAIMGRLPSGTRLEHLHLVLSASEEQSLELRTLLDQQQDKGSASYHHWLTPDAFGRSFGASPADVAKITTWLADRGFTVEKISKSSRMVDFAGTAGQVEAAFQTQMNTVMVGGQRHIANTTDLTVPSALASVVRGVASLNDFHPQANIVHPHRASVSVALPAGNYVSAQGRPLYSDGGSVHYVTPGDVATIYNSTPLLNTGVDGTGQTIAVLARSNITLGDVETFRSVFGLKKNDPAITVIGSDPGLNGDDTEAFLDAEWAGAVAPGAQVNFIVSGASLVSGGVDAAALYAVDNNIGDIVSLSYGDCETSTGASGTAFWNTLWEQAAAQGQTVFVSSGDSLAAGCNASNQAYGTSGYGVNALGSSNYNVAVGGSMFVDYGPATYWGGPAGVPYATASSYIPEAAWNEGALSTTELDQTSSFTVSGNGIVGTGGGISIYSARPSWQTGSGIAAADPGGIAAGSPISGPHRLVPDVALIASANHDGTLFCAESVCSVNGSGGLSSFGVVGGTSVAAPTMASVQALINQKNGGRQGNANFFYYALANAQYAASPTACQAVNGTPGSPTVTLPAAACNFHDIVAGGNKVKASAGDATGFGFPAAAGFDEATGLGSMNIANVAANWSTVAFRGTATSFTLSPASGLAHGAAQSLAVTVTPNAGGGTPGGDISLIAEMTGAAAALQFSLSGGRYTGNITGLPAGSYNVHVHYAGDAIFAGSDSASLPVTIGKENSTLALTASRVDQNGTSTTTSSFTYGQMVYLDAQATAASKNGTPGGSVVFSVSRNGSALSGLTTHLDAYGNTDLEAGASAPRAYLVANYPALSPGSYSIGVNYLGDSNFNPASANATLTVAQASAGASLTAATATIASGATTLLNYTTTQFNTANFVSSAASATGTVTFTDVTAAVSLGSAALVNGSVRFTTPAITGSGNHTIRAAYAGDGNYLSATSNVVIAVGTGTSTTTTLTDAISTSVGTTSTLQATVSPAVTGTVRFYDGSAFLGMATTSGGVATLNYAGFTAGMHNLQAVFQGTSTYSSSTGTLALPVSQATTATAIGAAASSIYGQGFALSAAISRTPSVVNPLVPLTGAVNFYDGGTLLGSVTPAYGGSYGQYTANLAPAATRTVAAGAHTLSVAYVGDANYTASASGTLSVTVAKLPASLSLSSLQAAYNKGGAVVLSALLAAPAGLAAPASTIAFYEGGTLLGSSAASYSSAAGGYVATLSVSGLAGGLHSLTAQFAGDANYAAAASATLPVTVLTNNVWLANASGTVSALDSTGAPVTASALGAGGTGAALAIDSAGNVWALNTSGNSVAEFTSTGTVLNPGYTAGGVNAPAAMAFDGAGLLWIANGNDTVSVLNGAGAAVTGSPFKSVLKTATSVNVDGSGNVWLTNAGNNTVTEIVGAATPVNTPQTNAVTTNTIASRP